PNSVVARLDRGKAYQASGRNDLAIADLTEAIRGGDSLKAPGQVWTTASVSPNARLAEAYVSRGRAYQAKHNNHRAIAAYTQATQLDSGNRGAYALRAHAYSESHQYDRAIGDWTRLIMLAPQNDEYYFERGMSYFGKKDYDRALADFGDVVRLKPNNA